MDFIADTKSKINGAKEFFKRKAKPMASIAAVGLGAVMLSSCSTSAGYSDFATRSGGRITQTTISPDGRTRTTTSQYKETDINDAARAARNSADALNKLGKAFDTWANIGRKR